MTRSIDGLLHWRFARVASAAALIVLVLAVLFPGKPFAQGGPADGNSNSNQTDPCLHAPDPEGKATGIARRCGAGGSAGIVKADFNGDGIADLAVGVPNEERIDTFTFNGRVLTADNTGAGAVDVLYGSASTGLTSTGSQSLDAGFFDNTENGFFGTAMAAGRFKSLTQQFSDLAVGAPGTLHNGFRSGAIMVFNGSATGLAQTQRFFADQFSAAGTTLNGATLTFPDDMTMAWGDFDGDGSGDLAVSVKAANVATSAVLIIFGSPTGLNPSRFQVIVVDDILAPGSLTGGCSNSCFTSINTVTVAAGGLKNNGRDQLLIGAPLCIPINDSKLRIPGPTGCVAVQTSSLPSDSNLNGNWKVLHPGFADNRSSDDQFGVALAIGDFDNSGTKDVAVGAPKASNFATNAGAVWVFQDGGNIHFQLITQNTLGLGGSQTNALFGSAVAANDFNGDGFSDLAAGAPGATVAGGANAGLVNVIYGSSSGLTTASSTGHPAAQSFSAGAGVRFGSALSAWNFGRTAQADLAVGMPLFSVQVFDFRVVPAVVVATFPGSGGVEVLYGSSPGGLSTSGSQLFSQQNVNGDNAKSGSHFGAAMY